MCGRYTLFTPEQVLEIRNIVKEAEERLRQRQTKNVRAQLVTGEICPTSLAPVLFQHEGRLAAAAAFWGFTNRREVENRKRVLEGKKPLAPTATFNTRGDRADASPFWQDSFRRRRCIIPASGFYEWYEEPNAAKTKYLFTMPGSPVLYIAGIWRNEIDEATGEKWPHYSILTTDPSESVAAIHNRMPLVLTPEEFPIWLGDGYNSLLTRPQMELDKKMA